MPTIDIVKSSTVTLSVSTILATRRSNSSPVAQSDTAIRPRPVALLLTSMPLGTPIAEPFLNTWIWKSLAEPVFISSALTVILTVMGLRPVQRRLLLITGSPPSNLRRVGNVVVPATFTNTLWVPMVVTVEFPVSCRAPTLTEFCVPVLF